jgi:hypothetical protein
MKQGVMEMLQRGVNQTWLSGMIGVSRSSMNRWHVQGPRMKTKREAHNAMSSTERQQILDLLHSEEFVEDTPYQVVSKLLDR